MFTHSPPAIAAGIALFGILALGHEAAAELPRNPLVQTLLPTPEEAPENDLLRLFGAQVAVDGDTALVGMAVSTITDPGRVPVFTRDTAGVWHRTDTLQPNPPSDLFFGTNVALDGDIAVISTFYTLFIFRRVQGVWTETTRLAPSDANPRGFEFTHYKGGYMVVRTEGAYYVYEVSPVGTVIGRTPITPAAPAPGPFTSGAPIAFDGRTLVFGLYAEDDFRGAAYVYRRHGERWLLEQKLIAINGESHDYFGNAAAIRGKHILIGAPRMDVEGEFAGGLPTQDGHSASGAVVVFTRANGVWSERGRIRPSPDELFEYEGFGTQIVTRGGRTVITAAEPYGNEYSEAHAKGVAFVYEGRADALTATSLATFVGGMGAIALAPPRQLLLGSPYEIDDSDIAIGRVDVFSLPKRTPP